MYVPHLMSEVNGTADVLVKSPDFFELGVKLSYDFRLTTAMTLQLNLGIQNLFDSYQNDFDKGATRDSGYIYRSGNSPHLLCGGQSSVFDFPLWTPVRYFIPFLFKLSIQASIRGFFMLL